MSEAIASIQSGNIALFQQLLPNVNTCNYGCVFEYIVQNGHVNFLDALLETKQDAPYYLSTLASTYEQLPIVERLLRDSRFSTETQVSLALGAACRACNLPLVQRLLKEQCLTVIYGDLDSVMRLEFSHNDAVKKLAASQIFARISQDSRFDPLHQMAHVFRLACMLDLVEKWLQNTQQ